VSTLVFAPSLLDQLIGEPTLDDLVVGVWRGLAAGRPVRCPLCGGEMERDGEREHGSCRSCGSTLS
jgi:hypothetical protein